MKNSIFIVLIYFVSAHCYGQKSQKTNCPTHARFCDPSKHTKSPLIKKILSDTIALKQIKYMVKQYKHCPLSGLETEKGFHIDSKLIQLIRDNPDIQSLYLYLGVRPFEQNNTKLDGSYTLIAIPGNAGNALIIDSNKNFEWHDTIFEHPPVNESILFDNN